MIRELRAADPESVGRYRLLGRLGAGGMGMVYLARSPGGRLVAIKVIRPELAGEEGFRARFAREVAAARNVSGVFTAAVVDADPDAETPWMATAFVPGPSLADAVDDEGPLPEATVRALAAGLAEGLQAIHAAGLVHRDLKPSNVLLANDGPRVIDFGISRAREGSVLTQTGIVMGSPGFLSPEQARGLMVGPASDVFSLGAVLAFAATGGGPFGGGPALARMYRVVHEPPDLSLVPAGLRALLEWCLAKAPGDRPAPGQLLEQLSGEASAPTSQWLPGPITDAVSRYVPTALAAAIPPGPATVDAAPSAWGAPESAPAEPVPTESVAAALGLGREPASAVEAGAAPAGEEPAAPMPEVAAAGTGVTEADLAAPETEDMVLAPAAELTDSIAAVRADASVGVQLRDVPVPAQVPGAPIAVGPSAAGPGTAQPVAGRPKPAGQHAGPAGAGETGASLEGRGRRRWRLTAAVAAPVIIVTVVGLYLGLSPAGSRKGTAGPSPSRIVNSPRPTLTPTHADTPKAMDFVEMRSSDDTTFNQLLAINNEGVIAGYFGSGAKGHPSKGYVIKPPYAQRDFISENFPGSVQTQVTGLNDEGVTVGFFSMQNNADLADNNFGFYAVGGHFHEVNFPTGDNANPPVDQLLGVNNHDVAVGFYTNAQGSNRGYTYNINAGTFTPVTVPGAPGGAAAPSLVATAINNHGDVAGFYNVNPTTIDGFLKLANGDFIQLAVPGAAMTQALGVNDSDWVVGVYTDGTGSSATMHGFMFKPGRGFQTNLDDPNGIGTTTLNGINDKNYLVGFYTDPAGHTDGLLVSPKS